MAATTTTLVGFLLVSAIAAAPYVHKDQRQTGELNVRAHLDNFIVVLIPTSNLRSAISWVDFTKRFNLQNHLKHVGDEKPKDVDDDVRVAAPGILDKTPYTVDVQIKSKPSSPLSRLHPLPVLDISSDVMIAMSPSVSLSKTVETVSDSSKTPVKTPPAPEVATETSVKTPKAPETAEAVFVSPSLPQKTPEAPEPAQAFFMSPSLPEKTPEAPEPAQAFFVSPSLPEKTPKAPEVATEATFHPPEVKPLEEPARMVKKSKSIISTTLDRVQKTTEDKDLRLKLLGAGIEVCASHERRGEDGNCEPIKARRRSGQYFASSGLLPSLRFGLSPAND